MCTLCKRQGIKDKKFLFLFISLSTKKYDLKAFPFKHLSFKKDNILKLFFNFYFH